MELKGTVKKRTVWFGVHAKRSGPRTYLGLVQEQITVELKMKEQMG